MTLSLFGKRKISSLHYKRDRSGFRFISAELLQPRCRKKESPGTAVPGLPLRKKSYSGSRTEIRTGTLPGRFSRRVSTKCLISLDVAGLLVTLPLDTNTNTRFSNGFAGNDLVCNHFGSTPSSGFNWEGTSE